MTFDAKPWADRLLTNQKIEPGSPYLMGDAAPTPNQIAAVLHALADHTLNQSMYDAAPELGIDRDSLGERWQFVTGLGRYFQRLGDAIEGRRIRGSSRDAE